MKYNTLYLSLILIGLDKFLCLNCILSCQILAGGNREALAVSAAAGLNFIRVEGFIFGHLADEGYMDACAGQLMRYKG